MNLVLTFKNCVATDGLRFRVYNNFSKSYKLQNINSQFMHQNKSRNQILLEFNLQILCNFFFELPICLNDGKECQRQIQEENKIITKMRKPMQFVLQMAPYANESIFQFLSSWNSGRKSKRHQNIYRIPTRILFGKADVFS